MKPCTMGWPPSLLARHVTDGDGWSEEVKMKARKEMMPINVNMRSAPNHREKPTASTNRKFEKIPQGADTVPTRGEQLSSYVSDVNGRAGRSPIVIG